jgi:hypothetical protein
MEVAELGVPAFADRYPVADDHASDKRVGRDGSAPALSHL